MKQSDLLNMYLLRRSNLITARLPAEYQEVEYIESTGLEYLVLTPGTLTTNTFMSIDYQITGRRINQNNGIFGLATASRYGCFMPTPATGNEHRFFYGGNGSMVPTYLSADIRQTVVMTWPTLKFYVGGSLVKSTDVAATQIGTNLGTGFRLFSIGGFNANSIMRCWHFKMWTRGNADLSIDLVPCYRKADNVIGMYDIIGNEFKTNSGTGSFTKGNNV